MEAADYHDPAANAGGDPDTACDNQQSFVRLDGTMSTKLKRQRLYEMFPAVDKTLLSEAFKHNE